MSQEDPIRKRFEGEPALSTLVMPDDLALAARMEEKLAQYSQQKDVLEHEVRNLQQQLLTASPQERGALQQSLLETEVRLRSATYKGFILEELLNTKRIDFAELAARIKTTEEPHPYAYYTFMEAFGIIRNEVLHS